MRTLILTHGNLAHELLASAEVIAGKQDCLQALALDWNDSFEQLQEKLGEALHRLDDGSGLLILTDMFGGTPCNVALTFAQPGKVEVVTGVNLPMVLRLGCSPGEQRGVEEIAKWLQCKGQQSICLASHMGCGKPAGADNGRGDRRS